MGDFTLERSLLEHMKAGNHDAICTIRHVNLVSRENANIHWGCTKELDEKGKSRKQLVEELTSKQQIDCNAISMFSEEVKGVFNVYLKSSNFKKKRIITIINSSPLLLGVHWLPKIWRANHIRLSVTRNGYLCKYFRYDTGRRCYY